MRKDKIDLKNWMFLFGMFLITVDGWKYGWFGIQKYNPLAEIPLLLFLLIACIEKKSIVIDKRIIVELVLAFSMVIYSFYLYEKNNYPIKGFINGVNLFAFYYLMFFAIRVYLYDITKAKLCKMLRSIMKSYNIALIVGGIQLFNIVFHEFSWYRKFILLFTENTNDISTRVRFTFSEPASAIYFMIFLYITVLILLKKLDYHFTFKDKIQMALVTCGTLLTLSINVYITIVCLCVCYMLYKHKYKAIIYCIGVFFIGYGLLVPTGVINFFIRNERILSLIKNPLALFMMDNSIKTRICYYYVMFESLKKHLFFGYGWNYYIQAMRDAAVSIPSNIITSEYIYRIENASIFVSYEAIFCSITCGGIIGGIWLLYILATRFVFSGIKEFVPLKMTFIISLFLGIGFMRIIPIILFMELSANKNVIRILKSEDEYD